MTPTEGHGVAVWSTPQWRAEAESWLDEQLKAAGIERRGDVEQPHLRPWATVLRAPTAAGTVWFKATGPGTAFEVGLYEVLAEVAPERVLTPIATDRARGWMILPDGGPPLGERLDGQDLVEPFTTALVHYARLQLDLVPRMEEILTRGVADMRPPVMSERFEEALEATGTYLDERARPVDRETHRRVAAMRKPFASWCEQLAASPLPAGLDHNDLHPWNVLGDGPDTRFYDWGDSVVAHPFAAMLVPLGFVRHLLGTDSDGPRFRRARDAYLEVFTAFAPRAELTATLEVACRVAKVARVLTWDRAVRAARDQGDEISDQWTSAPLESLAALLDDDYLGGA